MAHAQAPCPRLYLLHACAHYGCQSYLLYAYAHNAYTYYSLAHEFHVLCRLGAHVGELGDENVAEGVELGRLAVMHAQLLQNPLVGGGRW